MVKRSLKSLTGLLSSAVSLVLPSQESDALESIAVPDLIQRGSITLSSGRESGFKIECDRLSDEQIHTFAWMIKEQMDFRRVVSVPRGGNRLARALINFTRPFSKHILVVDDVLTTGESISEVMDREEEKLSRDSSFSVIGVTMFARGELPPDVTALFSMDSMFWHM